MAILRSFLDKAKDWIADLASTAVGKLLWLAVIAALGGLASATSWISPFGPIGWVLAGIVVTVALSLGLAVCIRALGWAQAGPGWRRGADAEPSSNSGPDNIEIALHPILSELGTLRNVMGNYVVEAKSLAQRLSALEEKAGSLSPLPDRVSKLEIEAPLGPRAYRMLECQHLLHSLEVLKKHLDGLRIDAPEPVEVETIMETDHGAQYREVSGSVRSAAESLPRLLTPLHLSVDIGAELQAIEQSARPPATEQPEPLTLEKYRRDVEVVLKQARRLNEIVAQGILRAKQEAAPELPRGPGLPRI